MQWAIFFKVQKCSVRKGVLKNSHNLQENTFAGASFFNKVAG